MNKVTQVLTAIEQGDQGASEQLLPLVYEELRTLAAQRLAQEKPGQTLQATALVHEAYMRLLGPGEAPRWNGRGHFFAAAAEAMRRILIDRARQKNRQKHGGGRQRLSLDELTLPADDRAADELLLLDDALDRLAEVEPIKAQVVKLRYFTGLSLEEAAACLDISVTTVKRHWAVARAWLYAAIADTGGDAPDNSSKKNEPA
jgi:RNA polymerase sigma factor (TIGR02999 family)